MIRAGPAAADDDPGGLLPVSGPGCPDVALRHVSKTFGEATRAVIDFSARLRARRVRVDAGAERMRQDHHPADDRGPGGRHRRPHLHRREDVTDLPPSRRDTAMMFQSFALFPHRTVFQNVEFSLKMKGMDPEERTRRVWQMLEMVSLAELASRRPSDLSGGQQQRVALARALIGEPTVLLLDEPLGALDYNLRQQMMVELKKIQRETGITFVMVTHSQQEAMSDGRQGHRHERRGGPADRDLARDLRAPPHQVRGRVHRQQQHHAGDHPLAQRLDRLRRELRAGVLRAGPGRRRAGAGGTRCVVLGAGGSHVHRRAPRTSPTASRAST